MALVQLMHLAGRDALSGGFGSQQAAIDVEGTFDAVFVEDGDQMAVGNGAVVIAHGQNLESAAREAMIDGVHNARHPFFLVFIDFWRLPAVLKPRKAPFVWQSSCGRICRYPRIPG